MQPHKQFQRFVLLIKAVEIIDSQNGDVPLLSWSDISLFTVNDVYTHGDIRLVGGSSYFHALK